MYLPQYHSIPENDEFWGKGFTDWVTVKKAKPLFKGHEQPKVPLDNNYYDLSLKENVKWQAKLAKEYGIYGFGVYHYWFNNEKNLLTKPAEIIRDNDDIPINYFLAWDNANWKRSWSNVEGNAWAPVADVDNKGPQILIEYILGEEKDWENHFNYLKLHFDSSKYIKVDNKPVFIIFNYSKKIEEMCSYWNQLAINNGYNGMFFIFKRNDKIISPILNNVFKYEPLYSGWNKRGLYERIEGKITKWFGLKQRIKTYNYDKVWRQVLKNAQKDSTSSVFHGAFVRYDDTPRRGRDGRMTIGDSPTKFGSYFNQLRDITEAQGKKFIFLTAWNEWGEGAYLEPDNKYGLDYIKFINNEKNI